MSATTPEVMTSVISETGKIVLPLEIRECLGVREGDVIEFTIGSGGAFLRRVEQDANPFARWAGSLPGFTSMDEVIAWERDMRDPDGKDE